MIYRYLAVDSIPNHLAAGVVYHNEDFELAALLCACGCGHRVTLLVPDSHQISSESGLATIRPSIAVCDAACKSHYYITTGEVQWLPAFTDGQAHLVMRDQIARHALLNKGQLPWFKRVRRWVLKAASTITALFRGKRR